MKKLLLGLMGLGLVLGAFLLFGTKSTYALTPYTQADFAAFDGVNIGTNSYTVSSDITATYTTGAGTVSDPVNLTLTGYAPIVTPWFGPDWTTYNYVTIGIRLPAEFTGTSVYDDAGVLIGTGVYDAGVIRYDRNPGNYEMGTGSTPLATSGAALGYLDYSFAANSTNTKKDGLVKLQVIWTEGVTEYFTIDISNLSFTPVPTPETCVGDQHLDATGLKCVSFSQAGPPPVPPATGGQVLGASTTSTGQVLGASTLAGTGSFAENLYLAMMTIGGLITAAGAINFKKTFKAIK